ncbi:MAG: hypothetical protein KIT16_12880 [Rhodospirillaceae bacterium]|nr:hypothetical protein [Rhodospirillaceae bacterium]
MWQSLHAGVLALPPTYDDVGYYIDAVGRLEAIHRGGAIGFLTNYATSPPHSPLSSLLAMMGFALFGLKPWAASAAMSIPLALLVRSIFLIGKGIPIWMIGTIAAALMASPMAGIVVTEFRPDALCGIITACGILFIVGGKWQNAETFQCMLAGGLFALALWAKPAIFALTCFLFVAAMVVASLPDGLRARKRRLLLRACALTVATAAVLAAPHYFFALRGILTYFLANFAGEYRAIWNIELPLVGHLLYYITGPGGIFALGAWLIPATAMAIASLAAPNILGDSQTRSRVLRLFGIAATTYAAVTWTAYKTPFIGISFAALVTVALSVGVIFWTRSFFNAGQPRMASSMVIGFAVFSLVEFTNPWIRSGRGEFDQAYARHKNRMVSEMVDVIETQGLGGSTLVEPIVAQYMNSATINFAMMQRHLRPLTAINLAAYATPDHYRKVLPHAAAAIAFSPDADVLRWLPSARLLAQFLRDLTVAPDWTIVRDIQDGKGVGSVFLFRRLPK